MFDLKLRLLTDLGFGLDFDVEGGDPGGEDAGEAFAGEGVEEMEAGWGEPVEATPLFHHRDARLFNAPTKQAERVPHRFDFDSIRSLQNQTPPNLTVFLFPFFLLSIIIYYLCMYRK